jgi:hypothetical protein
MSYWSKFIVEPGEQASFEKQTFATIWFRWTASVKLRRISVA